MSMSGYLGAHPFQRWREVPGPRGWLSLFFFSIFIICTPVFISFQMGLLGSVSARIFPSFLPETPDYDIYLWATVWVVVSFGLLVVGR